MNYTERTCEYCNKIFLIPSFLLKRKAARFCSTQCFRGNLHKSHRDFVCPVCHKIFSWSSKDKDRKYCSKKCYAESLKGVAFAPFNCSSKKITRICEVCGKEMLIRPSQKKKRCSRECFYKRIVTEETKRKMRENSHPEKNINYKGGISKTRAYKNFYALMHIHRKRTAEGNMSRDEWESVKKGQNYKCAICGKGEPQIKLTIDHIIPSSKGGSNYAYNVQALCNSCNARKYNKIAVEIGKKLGLSQVVDSKGRIKEYGPLQIG